ncbi:CRISPR-associated endonuclease Cas3'', partial [Parathermosynechococcus lividus]
MTQPSAYAHTPNASGDWHGLAHHLQKVAARSRTLAEKLATPQMGYYTGLWHDLGKYNPDFQAYLQGCAKHQRANKSVPHAKYGALLAYTKNSSPLAVIIYGHHSGLPCVNELKNRLAEVDRSTYAQIEAAAKADEIDLALPETVQQELAAIAKHPLDCEL